MATKSEQYIRDYLCKLGFDDTSIAIYVLLVQRGPLTILELARLGQIERTRIYRLVDDLVQKGLIEEVVAYKKRMFKAADANSIEHLVNQEKEKVNSLSHSFMTFSSIIGSIEQKSPLTNVVYYKGADGLKQVLWNELEAKKEIVGYTYRNLQEVVGNHFFDVWGDELEERGLRFRDIRGEEFIKSTKISGYKPNPFKGEEYRYLPSSVFYINHQVDIYNDVVTIYNWYRDEVFAVEIHNTQVAQMQKAMFEVFWQMAKPYTEYIPEESP